MPFNDGISSGRMLKRLQESPMKKALSQSKLERSSEQESRVMVLAPAPVHLKTNLYAKNTSSSIKIRASVQTNIDGGNLSNKDPDCMYRYHQRDKDVSGCIDLESTII